MLLSQQIVFSALFLPILCADADHSITPDQCKALMGESREEICQLSSNELYLERTKGFTTFQPFEYNLILQQYGTSLTFAGRTPNLMVHQLAHATSYSTLYQNLETEQNCVVVFYRQKTDQWPLMVDLETVAPDIRLQGTMADNHPHQMCFNVDCQKDIDSASQQPKLPEFVTVCCLCRFNSHKGPETEELKEKMGEAMHDLIKQDLPGKPRAFQFVSP